MSRSPRSTSLNTPNALRRMCAVCLCMLALAAAAQANEVRSFRWIGEDLYLRFGVEVMRSVDLVESDTSQLVIRIRGRAIGSDPSLAGGAIEGPRGVQAILTPSGPNELRLTVRSSHRAGFASQWRPYAHALVVHTFDWDHVAYAQEQYYKGLIALEQGLDAAGLEMLEVARSTGENRAAAVLGVYYARTGNFKRAATYLMTPRDADDYAALAAINRHNGAQAAADEYQHRFESMTADSTAAPTATGTQPATAGHTATNGAVPDTGTVAPTNGVTNGSRTGGDGEIGADFESNDDVRAAGRRRIFLIVGLVGFLVIVAVAIHFARRSPQGRSPKVSDEIDDFTIPPDLGVHVPRPPSIDPTIEVQRAVVVETPPAEPVVYRQEPHPPYQPPPHETHRHEPAIVTPEPAYRAVEEPRTNDEDQTALAAEVIDEPAVIAAGTVIDVEVRDTEMTLDDVDARVELIEAQEVIVPETGEIREVVVVEDVIVEESDAERSPSSQAADLRRRIEEMRRAAEPAPVAAEAPAATDETTLAEARRLHLSRDTVDLRRRMERARSSQRL